MWHEYKEHASSLFAWCNPDMTYEFSNSPPGNGVRKKEGVVRFVLALYVCLSRFLFKLKPQGSNASLHPLFAFSISFPVAFPPYNITQEGASLIFNISNIYLLLYACKSWTSTLFHSLINLLNYSSPSKCIVSRDEHIPSDSIVALLSASNLG